MAQVIEPVRIEGLKPFQAALKDLDGESQKRLRVVFNRAAELVADGAQARVPRRTGAARASIRVGSTQREARVKGGNKRKAPYYPWLDFGGRVGRGDRIVRPFIRQGRYIYRTYDRNRDDIFDRLVAELDDLVRSVGWDNVKGGG